jgi:DNA-binding transcriptional LysR family regulator
MINYTLKQLYSFEAVVRLKSFTKASKELYITQPAVCKMVYLEKKLQQLLPLSLLQVHGQRYGQIY